MRGTQFDCILVVERSEYNLVCRITCCNTTYAVIVAATTRGGAVSSRATFHRMTSHVLPASIVAITITICTPPQLQWLADVENLCLVYWLEQSMQGTQHQV